MSDNQADQILTIDELTKFFEETYSNDEKNHNKCLYYPILQFVTKQSVEKVRRKDIEDYLKNEYKIKFGNGQVTFAIAQQFSHRFRDEPILNKIFIHDGVKVGQRKGNYGLNATNRNVIEEYLKISTIDENRIKLLILYHEKVLKEKKLLKEEKLLKDISGKGSSTNQQKKNPDGENKVELPFLNQILYGPPGTGKTYNTINKAVSIANPGFDLNLSRNEIKIEYDRLMRSGQIVFTTFHQSMNYEDFIEGIKPETNQDGNVVYEVKSGIFKKLCEDALTPNHVDFNVAYEKLQKDLSAGEVVTLKTPKGLEFSISLNSNYNLIFHTVPEKNISGILTKENIQRQINGKNVFIGWEEFFKGVLNHLEMKYQYTSNKQKEAKNFVLIIDEINRGNVSQIFGELITLIEEDKRLDKEEKLEVTLPYSQDKFGVPPNVYIIGTMNTADRSVEALDAALRRRFSFEEMQPKPDLIASEGKSKPRGTVDKTDISLPDLLTTINCRIEMLLDKDHQIGHSYFMSVSDISELRKVFQNKIIPLLQEYFFGDYGKLGLVIGKNFFEDQPEGKEIKFATFNDDYDASDFNDRSIYKIRNVVNMSDELFIKAIEELLSK